MKLRQPRDIHSSAIGAKIKSLSYDAESGYVVIELDSGEELWISADWAAYHVFSEKRSDERRTVTVMG